MEYAVLFALMGTWILWLQYRNYKLIKSVRLMVVMMDKIISQEVTVRKTANGFELSVKNPQV